MTAKPVPDKNPEQSVAEIAAAARQFEDLIGGLKAEQEAIAASAARELNAQKLTPRKGPRGIFDRLFNRHV